MLPPAAVGRIRDDDAAPLVAKLRTAHYEPQPPPFKIPTDPQPSVHDPYCAKQQLSVPRPLLRLAIFHEYFHRYGTATPNIQRWKHPSHIAASVVSQCSHRKC